MADASSIKPHGTMFNNRSAIRIRMFSFNQMPTTLSTAKWTPCWSSKNILKLSVCITVIFLSEWHFYVMLLVTWRRQDQGMLLSCFSGTFQPELQKVFESHCHAGPAVEGNCSYRYLTASESISTYTTQLNHVFLTDSLLSGIQNDCKIR